MIRFAAFVAALVAALLIVWAIGHALLSHAPVEPSPAADYARQHFPDRDENESAARVLATVARFDETELRRNRSAEIDYIRFEVASPSAQTTPPPEPLAKFFAENAAIISTLRAELASNPPPVWKMRADDLLDTPQPDSIIITQLFVMFASDAIAEHSHRNDAAAWSDLGAMWSLTQSLLVRPEIYAVLTALSGSRLITAVATKLTPPLPRWWIDFVAVDPRAPLARALDYDAWAMRTRAVRYPVGEADDENALREVMRRAAEPFVRPIRIMAADRRVRDMRELRRRIAIATPCERAPLPGALQRWSTTLQHLHRFMIEREGAAKLLAIEEQRRVSGAWPDRIDDRSICPREHWIYERSGNAIALSFSGRLPAPQTRIVTPLQYRR